MNSLVCFVTDATGAVAFVAGSILTCAIGAFTLKKLIKSAPDIKLLFIDKCIRKVDEQTRTSRRELTLYLIRHGESEANTRAAEFITGRSNGTPLTSAGMEQAHLLGARLRKSNTQFHLVITSPAARAASTAQIACSHLGVSREQIKDSDFVLELSQGGWTQAPRASTYAGENLKKMEQELMFFAPPGTAQDDGSLGESQYDVERRVATLIEVLLDPQAFLSNRRNLPALPDNHDDPFPPPADPDSLVSIAELAASHSDKKNLQVAIFMHGVAIRAFVRRILGADTSAAMRMHTKNTSITELKYVNQPGVDCGWHLVRLNDASHLDQKGN
eukprot:c9527_g1_i1.p1 GENE.c9527_g1_i1~~c9527_g1_i1.p1  ORF type:complete len:330 (+),score=77.88 c9527_g1_i1:146-1135(+)